MEEKNLVEIENSNGDIEKVEIITEIKSKREDKTYVIFAPEETIGDMIDINIGYIFEENGTINLEIVDNQEELNYVYFLMNECILEECNEK